MSTSIKALVANQDDQGEFSTGICDLDVNDLPAADVLVDVAYSTLNYKDGLAVTGKGKICRKFPIVCGIDLAGTVAESDSDKWQPGDRVLVNGFGLSETHWGGYAQRQRVKSEFLVRIPEALSAEHAMAIGTAGYTAMLCVNAIQDFGATPADGSALVTGGAGGVGSVAIMLLAALGWDVAASTGRPETGDYLHGLGAQAIIAREELARACKPLEGEKWAASIDSVGSTTLATVIAQTQYNGIVTACGLAGGFDLPASVMPFILRGVTLRGVESIMVALDRRERAWHDLATLLDLKKLAEVYQTVPLADVPELSRAILKGQVRGRIVVDVNA